MNKMIYKGFRKFILQIMIPIEHGHIILYDHPAGCVQNIEKAAEGTQCYIENRMKVYNSNKHCDDFKYNVIPVE